MAEDERRGTVVAVSSSDRHGYPTHPQTQVTVGLLGILGDAHSGHMRESFTKPGTTKENDRPISIVAAEVLEEMNETFGIDMQPGDFNEQILVKGMGDLADVEIGSTVVFDSGVTLQVTDNAFPCVRLEKHNGAPGMMKALLVPREEGGKPKTRRGILAKVISTGDLEAGIGVTIITPTQSAN